MILTQNTKFLIIGLGVIGGSYASALSEKGYFVRAVTKAPEDISYALERGMIAEGVTEPTPQIIYEADVIVLAIYPEDAVEWVRSYGSYMRRGSLLTDVSGVKRCVIEPIRRLVADGVEYISAHPMAGREQSGVRFSDPSVFHGANYIITPTEDNSEEAIEFCRALASELGFSRVSCLTPDEHDRMIAFLSQLTHCIAVSLMNANQTPNMEKYTGDSFRDLTRIAKINDLMWSKLFMSNKDMLLEEMDAFIGEFSRFRNMLERGDADGMREEMRAATARRSLFDKPSGKGQIIHEKR